MASRARTKSRWPGEAKQIIADVEDETAFAGRRFRNVPEVAKRRPQGARKKAARPKLERNMKEGPSFGTPGDSGIPSMRESGERVRPESPNTWGFENQSFAENLDTSEDQREDLTRSRKRSCSTIS